MDAAFSDLESHVKREKQKARQLRRSPWWKKKVAAGVCYYCGKKFKPSELTMDHVIPLSRGGYSEKINIVPCCKECNTKKNSLLPVEWEEYIQSLNKIDIS
ncbi:MAG: HNH endonuclease [Spirochaetota bacterium]